MNQIFVHIGSHKTGTTTIQKCLRGVNDCIEQKDWTYIQVPSKITKALMNAEQYSKEIAKAYRCELSKQISTHPPGSLFVLSSEALCGLPSRGYLNSGVVFSMLREALAEYKVTVIIYLRRQDSFVESMYSQAIHEGGCLGFDEFARKYAMLGSLDYARILNDLETYFGRNSLIVRSYHAASAKGLIDDFASVIGSDLLTTHFAASGSKNISYSRNALEIARFCNASLDEINKKKLRHALQHVMPHGSDEPLRYFSEDARNEFLEKYEFSNNEVAFRFFGGNLNNLFPRPSAALRYCPVSSATNAEVSMIVLHLLGQDAQQSAVEVKQKLAIQAAKVHALESELSALFSELNFERRINKLREEADCMEVSYNLNSNL